MNKAILSLLAIAGFLAVTRAGAEPENTNPAPSPFIDVEAKFLEFTDASYAEFIKTTGLLGPGEMQAVLTSAQMERITKALEPLEKEPGRVELLGTPQATVKANQEVLVEIIKEFKFATEFRAPQDGTPMTPLAFGVRPLGVHLGVTPTIKKGEETIQMQVVPMVVEFLGFKNLDDKFPVESRVKPGELIKLKDILNPPILQNGNPLPSATAKKIDVNRPYKPIFSEYKRVAQCKLLSGQTAAFRLERQPVEGEKLPPAHRVFFVLITAKTSTKVYPAGIVKPGDAPGFVHSPYNPDGSVLDVRGLPPGTLFECPVTEKLFSIPGPQ